MNNRVVGVDLAKRVIQVCITCRKSIISNNEMTPLQFDSFLAESKPMKVIFEACATSNYWKQQAIKYGHDAKLVSPKLVANIRQNQKTDKNDALAVVQASQLTDIKFINGKTFEQQELQSIMRMRELAVKQRIALRNQISSILLEFNIRASKGRRGLDSKVQSALEDSENGFCIEFRESLRRTWSMYLSIVAQVKEYDKLLEKAIKLHPNCQKLLAIEGIGIINAINLYICLTSEDVGVFKSGRDASASIGVTPVQYSSGGKTQIGHISRKVLNSSVRSYLVNGAMSYVLAVDSREPKNAKAQWLKNLINRRGKKCAAVALANKNIRTAFALLKNGTEYKVQAIAA